MKKSRIWILFFLFLFQSQVDSDTSFLYNTAERGFQDWSLMGTRNGEEETIPHNFTSIISYNIPNVYSHVDIISPVISVKPAWKFTMNIRTSIIRTEIALLKSGGTRPNLVFIFNPTDYEEQEDILVDRNGDHLNYWRFGVRVRVAGLSLEANITSLTLTYINCPKTVYNLAEYNNTAASEDDNPKGTDGKCVENAERADGYNILNRLCDRNGVATYEGVCRCKEGHERKNNKCKACPENFFRTTKMKLRNETSCLKCGERSEDSMDKTACRCNQNTFRIASEQTENSKNCYFYPEPPRNFQLSSGSTTVTMQWLVPGNNNKLKKPTNRYIVKCTEPKNLCKKSPKAINGSVLTSVFKGLYSHINYKFTLCAHNEVSSSNQHEMFQGQTANCVFKEIRTKDGFPTEVADFKFSGPVNEVYSFLWEPPISTGSANFHYVLTCDKLVRRIEQDMNPFQVTINTKEKSVLCSMKVISSIGEGPAVNLTLPKTSASDSNSVSVTVIVVSVSVGLISLIVIVAFLVWCLRRTRPRQQPVIVDNEALIMEAVQRLMAHRTRNLYVPLDISLEQTIVALEGEAPLYEEVPLQGYNYPAQKLNILDDLGEGNFAKVYRAEAWDICGSIGKSVVAVKELKADCDKTDRDDFEGELNLMQDLKYHENVVRLLGICSEPRCMIVEYLPGGDLLSFLLKSRQYRCQSPNNTAEGSFLTAEHLVTFAWQISLGMNHIAQHNICHRDLACRNILVGYNRVCKVADLGLARRLNEEGIYKREKQAKLPVKWLPPESIQMGRSSKKSDVWSFGILLWEIVTIGGVPYPDFKSKEVPQLLREGYRMPRPDHCDDEIYDIMSDCWSETEDLRPSFLQLSKSLEKLKKGNKTYINLSECADDAYLPLDDESEFIDGMDFNDDNDMTVVHHF